MIHAPEYETFAQLARQYEWVPVYRRLLCDSLTPVSAFHRIDSGGSACLFESVIGGREGRPLQLSGGRPVSWSSPRTETW